MDKLYYDMMVAMEKAAVDKEYVDGWASGFMHNPRRGEQYLTDGYEAGYKDGWERVTDGYQGRAGKKAA